MSLEKLHPKWQSCDDHGDLIAHAEVQSLQLSTKSLSWESRKSTKSIGETFKG